MSLEDADIPSGSVTVAFRGALGKVGLEKAQRVINVLLESPFFYRDDDVDLFGLLRRRQSLFREFFDVVLGWQLYVDQQVARLIKPKTFNQKLRPNQRHVFRITGRHQYVLFMMLLEFYQHQADEQNVDLEREAELRFVLADFVDFAFRRYREELADKTPEETLIFKEMQSLFRKLENHRFICLAETTGVVAEDGLQAGFTREGASSLLYALLPGLRCYHAEELNGFDLNGSIGSNHNGNAASNDDQEHAELEPDEEMPEEMEAES